MRARTVAVAVSLITASWPAVAHAQTPPVRPAVIERPAERFLPRTDFYFQWSGLRAADPRFGSAGAMGLSADLVDYKAGRLGFAADYEAVLGNQARPFEINHDNFALEAFGTARIARTEVAAAFHHVSRHLSDRANPNIVAWNVIDVRAMRRVRAGGAVIDGQLSLGHVLQSTYVDYTWTADLQLAIQRPLSSRTSLIASGVGRLIGTDRQKLALDRKRQCGSRLEAGVRIAGGAMQLDLFAAYERRIDGFPIDRVRMRMTSVGFRLGTK